MFYIRETITGIYTESLILRVIMEDIKSWILQENTKEFRHLEVIMICGPENCEIKSKAILESEYIVNVSELVLQLKSWDDYNQEKTICITGFIDNKKTPIRSSIIDGYQCRLNIRRSFTYANWDKVYITTNIKKEALEGLRNSELYQGFFRRITKIVYTWPLQQRALKLITPDRSYQVDILNIIKNKPDNRNIYWYFDRIGNVGKSCFAKYLCARHDALIITGKISNTVKLQYAITKWQKSKGNVPRLIIYDIPRSGQKARKCKVDRSYECLEICKDMCFSYKGKNIIGNSPHLIVFSNEPPNTSKMNIDRWKIFEIDHNSFETSSWVG